MNDCCNGGQLVDVGLEEFLSLDAIVEARIVDETTVDVTLIGGRFRQYTNAEALVYALRRRKTGPIDPSIQELDKDRRVYRNRVAERERRVRG